MTNNKQQTAVEWQHIELLRIILFTLAVGMIAGCSESNGYESKWPDTIPKDAFVIEAYSFEGHKYITYINGGLVHAESCECKNKGGEQ